MKELAIKAEHVYKSFKLPHEKQNSIKGALINHFKSGKNTYEKQNVLTDISFEIEKGDFFGIVGRNGSGKSTLLKMIAGIYSPNQGTIQVNGKLTPFIELGVGFNPELTGRENVFLNGALLGFNRADMLSMYDDIVSFAEIERFMDQKLKNYSSGMQVRLAFSIAIRARSSILLLDEVLAVGDEAFQRKCFDYFENLKRNKQTVILVTHDMSAVERFCNKAMFIEEGEIKVRGNPLEVAAAYSRSNDENYRIEEVIETDSEEEIDTYKKSGINIRLLNDKGIKTSKFDAGSVMTVELTWQREDVGHVGVALFRQSGEYIFGPNTFQDHYQIAGSGQALYKVELNLAQGTYFLQAGLFGKTDAQTIEFEERGPVFAVNRNKDDGRWGGVTKLKHEWE